jgi:hypothetical protein
MESLKDRYLWKPSELIRFEDDDRRAGIDFIKREELESNVSLDDCFQIRCVVFIDKFPAVPPPDLATKIVSGSHVLTVDGYSKTRRAFVIGEAIESSNFHVGGHNWCFYFYPFSEHENKDDDRVTVNLSLDDPADNDEVKVRFEITLLTHSG